MKQPPLPKSMIHYFFMLAGCLFYALSLDLFIVPCNIVGGGITGIATIFNILFGTTVGTVTILLNLPILVMGLRSQGLAFIIRCFITNFTLGVFTNLLAFLPPITDDPLLASMYGGLFQGIANGFFIRYLVSSGGTELLARLIHNWIGRRYSIPSVLAVLDGVIVLFGAIALGNPQNVLYALILIFISAMVSDTIVTGLNRAKLCYIITDHADELAEFLTKNSPRGVTKISATGMYTRQPRGILMTCVKKQQITQLKDLVSLADPDAFVIVSEATEVHGKGFATGESHQKNREKKSVLPEGGKV